MHPTLLLTNIDVEVQPDRLSMWLPVSRPIWRGSGGLMVSLVSIAGLFGLFSGAMWVLENKIRLGLPFGNILGMFLGAFSVLSLVMLISIAILTIKDVVARLGERAMDRSRPLRSLRQRIDLTQHTVVTAQGPIDLCSIQDLRVVEGRHSAALHARTATGSVLVAEHHSARVLNALIPTILEHTRRRRKQLVAEGIDPDEPRRIPTELSRLRNAKAQKQS